MIFCRESLCDKNIHSHHIVIVFSDPGSNARRALLPPNVWGNHLLHRLAYGCCGEQMFQPLKCLSSPLQPYSVKAVIQYIIRKKKIPRLASWITWGGALSYWISSRLWWGRTYDLGEAQYTLSFFLIVYSITVILLHYITSRILQAFWGDFFGQKCVICLYTHIVCHANRKAPLWDLY